MFLAIRAVRKALQPFIGCADLLLQVLDELLVHIYLNILEMCTSSIVRYTRKVKR